MREQKTTVAGCYDVCADCREPFSPGDQRLIVGNHAYHNGRCGPGSEYAAAPAPDKAEPSREAQIVQWLRREAHRIGFGERRIARSLLEQVAKVIESGIDLSGKNEDIGDPPPASWPPELVAEARKVRSNLLFWQDRCLNAPANLLQTFVVEGAGARHLSTDLLEAAILIDKLLHSAPPASGVRREALEEAAWWCESEANAHTEWAREANAAETVLTERTAQLSIARRFQDAAASIRSLAGKSGGGDA